MAEDTNIDEIRSKITRMHDQLGETTYYELLEVDQELDGEDIAREASSSFRNLAREWHVDRYDIGALGGEEYREKLQEIFSAVNTAYQVLSNEEKRTEYNMKLSGENTDIGALLNAESAFRKGQNMLDTGAYEGAHQQFKVACDENPEDPEYRAHFLYTEYLLAPKNEKGEPSEKTRSKEIYEELDDILSEMPDRDWLLAYLGVVAVGLKRYREAGALFNEALQYNPNNVTAKRQKRILKMRAERESNKGFFAKLMEKFKS